MANAISESVRTVRVGRQAAWLWPSDPDSGDRLPRDCHHPRRPAASPNEQEPADEAALHPRRRNRRWPSSKSGRSRRDSASGGDGEDEAGHAPWSRGARAGAVARPPSNQRRAVIASPGARVLSHNAQQGARRRRRALPLPVPSGRHGDVSAVVPTAPTHQVRRPCMISAAYPTAPPADADDGCR